MHQDPYLDVGNNDRQPDKKGGVKWKPLILQM